MSVRQASPAQTPAPRRPQLPLARPGVLAGLAVAAAVVALAFLTSSNVDPSVPAGGAYTWTLITLVVLGAAACAAAVTFGGRERAWGMWPVLLFAAFTALAALSISWSVQPDWSWYGANQLTAYLAAFTGAAALARIAPERWPALVGGLAAGTTALCAWALLAKVFPATLNSANTRGRLLAPFGYWNAIGVVAALGLPASLWAGTRPGASRLVRAACAPALTLGLAVVVLSYSRSAVLSAAVGCGLWLALAPRRLDSVALLAIGAAGAIPVAEWMLRHPDLNADAVAPVAQDQAGHTFGVVILLAMILVAAAGLAFAVAADRITLPEQIRRRIGTVLVGMAALIPVAGILALAASSRGLTGEISHLWDSLTSTSSIVKDSSSRLSQLGSSRPLYWSQAFDVFGHHVLAGAGALAYGIARLRYTTAAYADTIYAHGYVFQTLADLGLVGIAVTVALLIAWCVSAARTLGPWRHRAGTTPAAAVDERAGLMALGVIVVAFGVQSLLDWTWFFPGVSVPVLLSAGWLAGRGPTGPRAGRDAPVRRLRERPAAGAAVLGITALALAAAWLMWEPLHSAQGIAAAESANTNEVAFAAARSAATANPLSAQPLLELSILYEGLNDEAAAHRELVKATRVQPQNPEVWVWLAQFDIAHRRPREALAAAARIVSLDHAVDPAPDPAVAAAQQVAAAAQADLAAARSARNHRRARASSSRRHNGGPPARRTSTPAN